MSTIPASIWPLQLITGLNRKYESEPFGGFYLFHRHRVYNPREGAWMGWERKRGKLLELNHLLRQTHDPFPVKTGDISRLPAYPLRPHARFRYATAARSAQRMIGTMAHPLNRPLIDPELNIVTEGYGILQPRVGISVHSASRSRLQASIRVKPASISTLARFPTSTRIFMEKAFSPEKASTMWMRYGRFWNIASRAMRCSAMTLSKALTARAGLASDIEVIDDYPSHYSAYNGESIAGCAATGKSFAGFSNRVPNESGRLVANPISLVSRWKIVDNLRRSLIEPAHFFAPRRRLVLSSGRPAILDACHGSPSVSCPSISV